MKTAETGLYYYGARYYNPMTSIWLSVDRLAAKYPNSSPYVFTANNPIMLIDPNGDSVNVASLQMYDQASGTSTTCKSVSDLEDLTGLSISINHNGNLTYGKDDDGNAIINDGGSQEARSLLMTAIDDERTVNVTATTGDRSYGAQGGNYFRLSSSQIESFISGTSNNLDSRTMGYGMVFLHELDHTMLGQGLGDNHAFGKTGPIVDRMNLIRSQMGTNWGQRTSYSPGKAWGTSYIPMDNNSYRSLKHDMYPTSYIKR